MICLCPRKKKDKTKKKRIVPKVAGVQQNQIQLKPLAYDTYGPVSLKGSATFGHLNAGYFFDFEEIVGQGSIGIVFRAVFKPTSEVFAVKYLDNYLAWKRQIANELRVLQISDNCRYLLQLHSFFQVDYKYMYIVTNLCAMNFEDVIDGPSNVSPGLVRIYTKEVCTAVMFLHKLRIVHRDITLKNMLLDWDGHLRLGDYGNSKVLKDAKGEIFSDFGSLAYKAPEAYSDRLCGFGVDWWSVGVVLYRLTSGRFPFLTNMKISSSFFAVTKISVHYPAIFTLYDGLKSITEQFLQKNPKKRLGYSDEDHIKEHEYFNGLDWDAVEDVVEYVRYNAFNDPSWCYAAYKKIMGVVGLKVDDLRQSQTSLISSDIL